MKKVRKKKVPATTNNITKGVISFLLMNGHSASRVNVMGIFDPVTGKWRKSGSRKGFYDIAATIKTRHRTPHGAPVGVTLMIDVKRGRDSLSDDQIAFRHEIQNAGGLTFETENYDDFIDWYNLFIKNNYL